MNGMRMKMAGDWRKYFEDTQTKELISKAPLGQNYSTAGIILFFDELHIAELELLTNLLFTVVEIVLR